jgi:hypothetical protein
MRSSYLLTVLCLLCAPVMAADFFVKDKKLTALPELVGDVIRVHSSFADFKNCPLVGRKISLADWNGEGYIATTADECEWQATSGPIWIVGRVDGIREVVLAGSGYSLTIGQKWNKGYLNVSISAVLSGAPYQSLWEFNGNRYMKTKGRDEVAADLR